MGYPVTECPHCGCGTFYTKDYIYGSSWFYCNLDGTIPDNAAMHDSLNHKRGKVAYCEQCDKKLFSMEEADDEDIH